MGKLSRALLLMGLSSLFWAGDCWAEHQKTSFTPIQTDLFNASGGQAVAWADADKDGDLDLLVGFRNGRLKLFLQSDGLFSESKDRLGLTDLVTDHRALSWGDFNRDGYADLYLGMGRDSGFKNKLFAGGVEGFKEVSASYKLDIVGTTRQSVWLDYDLDGDSDLFVAMRDRTSRLYRNDGNTYTNVSRATGLADPRRSVGAIWFDYDRDGDLDLYLPNQSGDRDGFYRNDKGLFQDVAAELEMDRPRRPLKEGSVGATLCDVNNDGWFDIFVPVYGKDMLYIADGKGGFQNKAEEWGVDSPDFAVSADCGDYDNDGLNDLYVVAYQPGEAHGYDHLYHNRGDRFVDVFPETLGAFDADHGARWADYDNDGDLDLALTNRHADASHSIWRNNLDPSDRSHYLKVRVLDKAGIYSRQGDEVRVYDADTKALLGARVVDTGGGYISQNMMPLHFGLGSVTRVDVELVSMSRSGRKSQMVKAVEANQTIEMRSE